MKKTYRETWIHILGMIQYAIWTLGFAALIWGLTVGIREGNFKLILGMLLILVFMLIVCLYLHYTNCGERWFSKLQIFDDKIRWSCIGFFSVTLSIDEIQYAGIADFDDMNIGGLSIRGGQRNIFIYP